MEKKSFESTTVGGRIEVDIDHRLGNIKLSSISHPSVLRAQIRDLEAKYVSRSLNIRVIPEMVQQLELFFESKGFEYKMPQKEFENEAIKSEYTTNYLDYQKLLSDLKNFPGEMKQLEELIKYYTSVYERKIGIIGRLRDFIISLFKNA